MEELYSLVHSLNKYEKKYVRRFAMLNRNSSENVLPVFYDILEKCIPFNDDKIRNGFSKKFPKTNIFVYKKRLYDLVLNALKCINPPSTTEQMQISQLLNIRLLLSKGLYKKAKQDVENLLTDVYKCENYSVGLLLINLQKDLLRQRIYTKEDGYTTVNLKEKEDALLLSMKDQSDLKHLFLQQVDIMYKQNPNKRIEDVADMKKLMAASLLKSEKRLTSIQSKEIFYTIHLRNFVYQRNFEKALYTSERILEIYANAKFPIEFERLVSAYYLHILCAVFLDMPHKCQLIFEELQKLKAVGKSQEVLLYTIKSLTSIYYYYLTGDKDKCFVYVDTSKGDFVKLNQFIPFELKLMNLEMGAAVNISKRNYKESLWWLNQLLVNPKFEERVDLQCWGKFLYMVCHYELGNTDLLISTYKSYIRSANKLNHIGAMETLLFRFFKELINGVERKGTKINYLKYSKEFLELKNNINAEYYLSVRIFSEYLENKM